MTRKLLKIFHNRFGEPLTFSASPGRINMIGEHTDYNEGFVLPGAIDKSIYVAASKRNDNKIALYAGNFDQQFECELENLKPVKEQWPNYILGVVDQLQKSGYNLGGFNLVVDGDVPIGAGLSSSAAVECAVITTLNEMFSLGLTKMEMVKITQKAEHNFAGVLCGIMDQFASIFGKKDHVIKIDCRSLQYEYVPIDLKGYKIVLFNTNVKHSLASSQYNIRRQQCEQGVIWVKEKYSAVNSLRDVTIDMLRDTVLPKNELIFSRCKYVVGENQRLMKGCEALRAGDIELLGTQMFQTHRGLSEEYEVSCKELDFLVDYVKTSADVVGARMVGGGFGGCTINLIREEAIEQLIERIGNDYTDKIKLPLTTYIAGIENGASVLSNWGNSINQKPRIGDLK